MKGSEVLLRLALGWVFGYRDRLATILEYVINMVTAIQKSLYYC